MGAMEHRSQLVKGKKGPLEVCGLGRVRGCVGFRLGGGAGSAGALATGSGFDEQPPVTSIGPIWLEERDGLRGPWPRDGGACLGVW